MFARTPRVLARLGAVGALAAGTLATVGLPAHAVGAADLAISPISTKLARGVQEAKAKPFQIYVVNQGTAAATGVTFTADLSGLKTDRVGYVVPAGCSSDPAAHTFTCPLGDLAAGSDHTFGVPLFSTGGKGDGGSFTVTVRSATAEVESADNEATVDVTVAKRGYDLLAWAQDVRSDVVVDGDDAGEAGLPPVPAGGTAPLDWAVFNYGSRKAVGIAYVITLPAGVGFATRPAGCEEIPGLNAIACEQSDTVLKPGQVFTAPVTVRVDAGATEPVLRPGTVTALALADLAEGDQAPAGTEAGQAATAAQRRAFAEVDEADDFALFEVYVGAAATPNPTPTAVPTTPPGGGTGGGLPVTGVQVGMIGALGAGIVLIGAALFFFTRRKRVVVVPPTDGDN
jgi:LPXTG-motif cell wall-anchored protein